ncbi:MAG: squalene synthase HpnC [Alphaproteobacteria bacterium]
MTSAVGKLAETPSGKGSSDENFPVGSLLLPARLRPHIALFYAYARAIDDIADNPALPPEDKLSRLEGFAQAIQGETNDPAYAKGIAIRNSLHAAGITTQHCLDLISAFKQDAVKNRYADWGELISYCDRSAAPVGRYFLDLHEESRAGYPAADALCNALQIINHLQDCKGDYQSLDRVYLPMDWMTEAGAGIADLDADTASPAMRRVLDRCLDGVERLLAQARLLPPSLRSRRLAMESSAIVVIAERLTDMLRRRDPIAGRVELGKAAFLWCCLRGAARSLFR